MSNSPVNQNGQQKGIWANIVSYAGPPGVASIALLPNFRDIIAKSCLQTGQVLPKISILQGIKRGLPAAPTIGGIVAMQMFLQKGVENNLIGETHKGSLWGMGISAAIVGGISAPCLALFNGQSMGWSVRESLSKFTLKQGVAITCQETAFVGGLCAADRLAIPMKQKLGDNKAVEYLAAFVAGVAGSLVGHPANTALTRWQSGQTIDSFRQLWWGALIKARAIGCFSVLYKLGMETINSTVDKVK